MYSKPPQSLKIHYGRTKLPALQRFFFFSPLVGAGSLGLFGLFLLLCGCLFQPDKTLIADNVFNPAGVGLRSFGVNACGDKLLGKEAVTLVDFFGNFPACLGQMQKIIAVYCQKAALLQNGYGSADAGFGNLHVPGKVNRAHHTIFLLQHQYGF